MNPPIIPPAIPPPSNDTEALNSAKEYVGEVVRLLDQIAAEAWGAIANDIERMTRTGQGNWQKLTARVAKLLDQMEENAAWKKMKRTWKWGLSMKIIDFFVMFTAKLAALRTSAWLDRGGAAAAAVVASVTATSTATATSSATATLAVSHTAIVTMAYVTATAIALHEDL